MKSANHFQLKATKCVCGYPSAAKSRIRLFFFFALFILPLSFLGQSKDVKNYLQSLHQQGKEPVQFMKEALRKADLLIFDDAVHSAQEPFDFYQQLIVDPDFHTRVRFIFIEVFSITSQPYLDRFLSSPDMDSSILFPVFQNDFSGYGWRYDTYWALLKTVWQINHKLPEKERISVVGVDQPVYWESIKTYEDYELFSNSLEARDYFMYLQITRHMNDFKMGQKGIFLTNTRHAYTNLHSKDGKQIWNCATFFRQWHPGKTISIRIHNATLLVEKKVEAKHKTAQGTEGVSFRWVKMDNGKWDSAFALYGNKPFALYIKSTSFGSTPYIGNQMLGAKKGETMLNAYDALLFLGPIESLHFSGKFDFIYTANFKKELARRLNILYDGKTEDILKEYGQSTIEGCINILTRKEDRQSNTLILK